MFIVALRVIIRRTMELFFASGVISVALTIMNLGGFLADQGSLILGMLVGTAVFVKVNFNMLRDCYFDLVNNTLYYITNITAYLIFAAGGYAVYFLGSQKVYTWLFAVTKLLKYTNLDMAVPYSAAVFHCIGIAAVFAAPIGMQWIFMTYEE